MNKSKKEYFGKILNYHLKENQKFTAIYPKDSEEFNSEYTEYNEMPADLVSEYTEMPTDLVYKNLNQLKDKSHIKISCTMNLNYNDFLQATNTNKKL